MTSTGNFNPPQAQTKDTATSTPIVSTQEFVHNFKTRWKSVNVSPNDGVSFEVAYSFRKFRTMHLLNLRLLENEILALEQQFFQAGLHISKPHQDGNPNAIDPRFSSDQENISATFVKNLRLLIEQYGKNKALLDLHNLSSLKTFVIPSPIEAFRDKVSDGCNLRVEEISITRSVTPGFLRNNDPIWKFLRDRYIDLKFLRDRYIHGQQRGKSNQDNSNNDLKVKPGDVETGAGDQEPADPHQNPLKNEETNEEPEPGSSDSVEELTPLDPPVQFLARFVVALIAASLLVAPVAVLSWQSTRRAHLITLAVSTTIFSFLASFSSKSSLQETMVAVAGYTAVLVVFVAVASTNS